MHVNVQSPTDTFKHLISFPNEISSPSTTAFNVDNIYDGLP